MLFVVFRMRSWDILINCFKKTEDLLQRKKIKRFRYLSVTLTLLANNGSKINPTCRNPVAPCHKHLSSHRALTR